MQLPAQRNEMQFRASGTSSIRESNMLGQKILHLCPPGINSLALKSLQSRETAITSDFKLARSRQRTDVKLWVRMQPIPKTLHSKGLHDVGYRRRWLSAQGD
jgi:hypothetical protein